MSREFNKKLNKEDNIYFIAQNTAGYEYFMARYEYTPSHIIENEWSLGKKYSEEDIYTKNLTLEEFEKRLRDSTYIYLYKIDESFNENYGSLFLESYPTINNGDIFKIKLENEKIKLIKIN